VTWTNSGHQKHDTAPFCLDMSKNDISHKISIFPIVLEVQFQRIENQKLAFATATSNSYYSPQNIVQCNGIIS
jgi:hypothetical protein